jgi:hypothetical protein
MRDDRGPQTDGTGSSGGRLKLAAASRIFVGAAYGSGLHVEDVVTCALSLSGGVYDELPLIT